MNKQIANMALMLCLCAINSIKASRETNSTILPAYSMHEVIPLINAQAKNSLILIDIDDTLMIAFDRIMRNVNIEQHHCFMTRIKQEENSLLLLREVYNGARYRLVEEIFVPLVDELKQTALGVFGFTARSVGSFLLNDKSEDWTARKLTALGIMFSQRDVDLYNFKHGILFCSTIPKGDALQEFLKHLDAEVYDIIVIDDRLDNLLSVSQTLDQINSLCEQKISFLGIHYKAADLFDHTLDDNIVQKQLEYLIQHKKYFSEAEIKEGIAL